MRTHQFEDDTYETIPLILVEPPPPTRINKEANAGRNARAAWVTLVILVGLRNLDPFWFLTDAVPSKMKMLAHLTGQPELLALAFVSSVCLTLPYLFTQLFWPRCKYRKSTQILCIAGLYISSAAWAVLLYSLHSHGLDEGSLWWILARASLASLLFSAVLAVSLNNEQLLAWLDKK